VFRTNNLNKGWDGTFQGKKLDTGMFVWVLKAKDEFFGKMIEKAGTVVLLK
jgi:hypothetical protein